MSLSEILVILIVAILVCKPEDIKFIVKEFYKLKNYFLQIRHEIFLPFEQEFEELNKDMSKRFTDEQMEEINFYLHKIASLNESYDGEYSLHAIKQYYYQLIKSTHE